MDALGIYGAVSKLAVIIFLFTQMYRYAAEPYCRGLKTTISNGKRRGPKIFHHRVDLHVSGHHALHELVRADDGGKDFREGGFYMLPVILLANIFAGIWLNLSLWYKKDRRNEIRDLITGTGSFSRSVEPGADSRLGIFRSRARPAGLRNRHGRRPPLPEPETLSRPVRLAPDRDLLPGRRGDLRGVAATSALPAALEYTLNLAMLAAFGFYAIRLSKKST